MNIKDVRKEFFGSRYTRTRRSFFLVAIIAFIVFFFALGSVAYQADNFWPSFSLNLLTEIMGAALVALILKINLSQMAKNAKKEQEMAIFFSRTKRHMKTELKKMLDEMVEEGKIDADSAEEYEINLYKMLSLYPSGSPSDEPDDKYP